MAFIEFMRKSTGICFGKTPCSSEIHAMRRRACHRPWQDGAAKPNESETQFSTAQSTTKSSFEFCALNFVLEYGHTDDHQMKAVLHVRGRHVEYFGNC
jgi:hypothetical protein